MSEIYVYEIRGLMMRRAEGAGYALNVNSLNIRRGDRVAMTGPSGCGKSTFLDIMAGILRPDFADGFLFSPEPGLTFNIMEAWIHRGENKLAAMRLAHVGYILQTGGLLPFLSVKDNIMLALDQPSREQQTEIFDLAGKLGIQRFWHTLPGKLSVGERQRVAIARALAASPAVILADEPTASLDPVNASKVMKIFTGLAEEMNITVVLVTHAGELAKDFGFRPIKFSLNSEDNMVIASIG